jgi:hypothetical protein
MTTISAAATACEVEVDQPYYNDTYQDLTWSGTAGNDFIVINDNDDWWQNKVDEVIDIRDSNDASIFSNAVSITGSTRYQYYDSVQENRLYIDEVLANSYTNEAGNARAKVKRFHCNGYIDTNKNVMDNAKELLANMRGIFLYIDGKYELQIEDTGTSTFSITDDHIIADAGISVDYGNKDKKANKVVIEFFNANKKYELDTATVLHDASPEYYSDDGEVLEVKAEFPYVTDPYIAYNMGKAILTRSRNQTTMQFLGTPEMYKLNVGDIVDLTYLPLSFNVKVCRVEALELQANGLVSVSLIEYFDVYTWEVPAQEPVEIIAHPPSIGALHPPEANSIVFTDTDASSINRPTLTWTEPTDFPVRQYRVDVVDNSANNVFSKIVDTPSVDLAFLPKAANYEASITSFNGVGIESNASTKTFTIADDPVKTTEVEIGSETLSNIIDYGTIAGGGTQNFFQINTRLDLEDRFIWNSNGTNDWSLGTGGDDDVNLYIEGSADKLITFKDQSSELGSVKLTFGDDVSGSYFADFITLEADWTNGYVTTGSGLSKFYIKGKGYDGSTASGTIATFQLTSADGYGIPLTELHGKTKTPILNLDQGSAPSTTTDLLYNVGGSLYWNGAVVDTGAGDITSVTINTSGGSLTGGASFASGDATFTLDIGTTVRGSKTFEDDVTFESNVVIEGNLDVQGTTTTIDTANLDVKDKNITLNYGTGDTSANANGAGITIQDAISATQDATLTWNTANDSFNFSHPLNVTGGINSGAIDATGSISTTGSITSTNGTVDLYDNAGNKPKIKFREDNSDAFILEYNGDGSGTGNYVAFYSNVTGWVAKGSGFNYVPANGRVGIGLSNPSEKLSVSGNISATGTVSASSLGVTNIVTNKVVKFNGSILDDSNITDTGSAITLGSNTTVTGTIDSGSIESTGVITANDNIKVIGATGSSGFIYIFDRDNGTATSDGFLLQKSGNGAFVYNRESSGNLSLGAGDTNNYFIITSTGAYLTGTAQWFDQARNLSNIASYNGYTPTKSSDSTNSVISLDSRNVNSSPSARNKGLYVDFKLQTTIGLTGSGSYAGVLTFRSYGSSTDLSGGYPIQIAYDQAGNLQTRYGSSSSAWGSWKAIHLAGNDLSAGNITVTGTVDGRDIATDGTKLDGIEAGATTDQTQAEINALGITAIGLSGTPNITVGTINSGAIDVTGAVTADGLVLGDNDKAQFGDSNDLEIYHDGSSSYIVEQGQGSLIIRGGLNTYIQNTNGVTMAAFGIGGTAQLRYNGGTKLQTNNTGVDITGRTTTDGLTTSASLISTSNSNSLGGTTFTSSISTVGLNSSAAITSTSNSNSFGGTSFTSNIDVTGTVTSTGNIFMSTNGSILRNSGGALQLQSDASQVILRSNNTTALTLDTSQNAIFAGTINSGGITSSGAITGTNGTFSGSLALSADSSQLQLGTGNRAQIFHNGAALYLRTSTGGVIVQASTLNHYSADASTLYFSATSGGLSFGGTQFLTSSRNLTNIGAISSGAITSTGNATFNSNQFKIQHASPTLILKDTSDNADTTLFAIQTQNADSADSFTFYSSSDEIVNRIGTTNRFVVTGNGVSITGDATISGLLELSGGLSADQSGQTISGFSTIRVGDALIGQDVATLTTTSASQTNRILASATTYRTLKVLVQIKSSTNFHATEILLTHNGTTVYMTEYATIFSNTSLATFDADISGGNIRLLVDPNQATSTEFKFSVSGIET